ncbi:DUF6093 family protein [Streptosporangium sp. NPDC023963]|uniref:DUF6093 family protein n=1 Tax=Streptosporangium sp. NPDC023963 TaxID=3155608 RepID=UPI00343CD463
MSPLAGHGPIHPRWSEHHRRTAVGTLTGTCRITRGGGEGTVDDDNVWHPPASTVVYQGPCRITAPPGISNPVVGDQPTGIGDYKVAIRWDVVEILEGDIVEVLTAADPRLPGRLLQVTDTLGGGGTEQWERVLTATEDITHREAP